MLSIIIPVYNGEEHLPHIFRCLKEQTYKDTEVIFVVDSKTTDDSVALISSMLDTVPGSRMVMQNDAFKLGGARNIGIDLAEGEFIWFLDVDDTPLPEFAEALLDIQKENDADIVGCNFTYSYSREPKPSKRKEKFRVETMNRLEALTSRTKERFPITAWSKIIRTSLIRDNKVYYRSGYAEDIDFTYKILSCANRVCYYTKPLYIYYQDPNSICNSSRTSDLRAAAEIEVYHELETYFESFPEFHDTFMACSSKMRVRCGGHLSYKKFLEYAHSPEFLSLFNERFRDPIWPEGMWVRIAPKSYYVVLKAFLKTLYYRDNRRYTSEITLASLLKMF